jgi:hypothetical protein
VADESSIPPANGGNNPFPPEAPQAKDACTELVALARQAFQEKRRKDCLLLTRVILSIDSENTEARVIENWVRSDLDKDIADVHAVLEEASQKGDGELFQRAEWMLRSILRIDKDNPQAIAMLEEIRPSKAGRAAPDNGDDPKHLEGSDSELPPSELMDEYPGYPPEPTNRQRRFIFDCHCPGPANRRPDPVEIRFRCTHVDACRTSRRGFKSSRSTDGNSRYFAHRRCSGFL